MVVIIPAFDEESSIVSVVHEVAATYPDSTILVIDDKSTDSTAVRARSAGAEVLSLTDNLGIGGAVQAGYMWAVRKGADLVLRIDGDGQHDPLTAKALVNAVRAGKADVVIGSRFLDPPDGAFRSTRARRIGIRLFSMIVGWLVGQRITDPTSGLRCVNEKAARFSADHFPHDYPEIESLVHLHRAGLVIAEVPAQMRPRSGGTSSIRGPSSAYYFAKVLLALVVLAIEKRRH